MVNQNMTFDKKRGVMQKIVVKQLLKILLKKNIQKKD